MPPPTIAEALPYHQYGHIIGVATVPEATEGADVVPTGIDRSEGSPTEGSGGWCGARPSGVVAVDGGAPAGEGLGQGGNYTGRLQADGLQRLHTDWR